MCIGIPMQVVEAGSGLAHCRNGEVLEAVDTCLVGDVREGEWLMVFLGAARERISAEHAARCRDALEALDRVMNGDTDVDDLFADLVGREPQLPDFLANPAQSTARTGPNGGK